MAKEHVRVTHVALEPTSETVTENEALGAAAGYAIANQADALLAYEGKGYLCRHEALRAAIVDADPAIVGAVTKR